MIPADIIRQLHDNGFRKIEEGKCSICGTLCISCIHPDQGLGSLHAEDATHKHKICEGFSFLSLDPPISYKDPDGPEPPLVLRHDV